MQLPDPERVIYNRNPLVDVVSQLRFPPILKIANEDPVKFQDAIRDDYPLLEIINNVVLIGPENQLMTEPQKVEVTYQFSSEDLQWQVSLNKGFLAIATKDYKRYEEFKQRFKKIISVFEDLYKPAFYSRVGLRYQDVIIRSSLGLADQEWPTLIPQYIAPELHLPEVAEDTLASTKTLILKLETGQVAFRHGLVEAIDSGENLIEYAYLMDFDFFVEERTAGGENVWENLTSTTTQPESSLDGVLAMHSIGPWNLHLSKMKLQQTSFSTETAPVLSTGAEASLLGGHLKQVQRQLTSESKQSRSPMATHFFK